MNYIELSGPIISTQGNITLIDTNTPSVVEAVVANSKVLDEKTTTSTSPEPKTVVFTEIEKYLSNNYGIDGYKVVIQGKRFEW